MPRTKRPTDNPKKGEALGGNSPLPNLAMEAASAGMSPASNLSLWEQANRKEFKNYVPNNEIEFKANESTTGDVSLDRPMVIIGRGAGKREIPTDVIRRVMADHPQFFRGIDASNYYNLQNSLQNAYRSGHTGLGVLDNLILQYAQKGS